MRGPKAEDGEKVKAELGVDHDDGRVTPVYLVTRRDVARMNGAQALAGGNLLNAWRWFRRHDDLVLLAIARGELLRNTGVARKAA